jgi:hypothetical protein
MNRSEIFPSKYLKAADVTQPRTGTIASTGMEQFKNDGREQSKLVIYFRERGLKPLVCNMTNYDAIADMYGDETGSWTGQRIELFADRVRFGGKLVDSVRVRAPQQAALPMNGGNGAARPRPVANPQPPRPRVNPDPRQNVGTPPDDLNDSYDDAIPSFDPPGKA